MCPALTAVQVAKVSGLGGDALFIGQGGTARGGLSAGKVPQSGQQICLGVVVEEGAGYPGLGGDPGDGDRAAVDFTDGISGPSHPRYNRGPASRLSSATTSLSRGTPSLPMRPPQDS